MADEHLCTICRTRPRTGTLWCRTCGAAYDLWNRYISDGTVNSSYEWIARRVWRFAAKKVAHGE